MNRVEYGDYRNLQLPTIKPLAAPEVVRTHDASLDYAVESTAAVSNAQPVVLFQGATNGHSY